MSCKKKNLSNFDINEVANKMIDIKILEKIKKIEIYSAKLA